MSPNFPTSHKRGAPRHTHVELQPLAHMRIGVQQLTLQSSCSSVALPVAEPRPRAGSSAARGQED